MKQELYLYDVDYTVKDDKPIIRLYGKTKDGKSATIMDNKFKPYLYVIPKKDPEALKKRLLSARLEYEKGEELKIASIDIVEKTVGLDKEKVLKVYAEIPSDVPKLRSVIKIVDGVKEVREFDILFYRRYLYDKKDMIPLSWASKKEPELKVMAFDLEAVPLHGEDRKIICIGFSTSDGKRKALVYKPCKAKNTEVLKDEKAVLERFIEIVKKEDPDFLITYNGDGFDLPLMRDRAKAFGLSLVLGRTGEPVTFRSRGRLKTARARGRPHLDLFQFVSRIMSPALKSEVLTLDNVASELVGEKKKEMDWDAVLKDWESLKNMRKIVEYNLHDCDITLKLAEKVLPNIFAMSRIASMTAFDACRSTYGQLVENFAMRRAVQKNIVLPNRPMSEEMTERMSRAAFVGAFVVEPRPGLYKDIAEFDFRSLYPTIIVSHNIDPDTLNCGCCKQKNRVPGFDYRFCTEKKGFIPSVLNDLLDARLKAKAEMKKAERDTPSYIALWARQYALKTIANAFYGYLGFAGSRWYRRECAESVTAYGRHYIHDAIRVAEEEGFKVIYGDTDGLYLTYPGDISAKAEGFLKKVNSKLPGIMELEFEAVYKRGLFVARKGGEKGAKKRYALIDADGRMKIRGFEKVRRDWSSLSKDTQEKVLRLVLTDRKDDAVKLVKKNIEALKKEKVDIKDLVIYSQITRPLDKYAQIGPHVAAARKAKKAGVKIASGMVIPYVITKGAGSISDRAVLAATASNYDSEYYVNNQVIPAALRVLRVLGVTEDDLLGKAKQKGLGAFARK